MPFVYVATLLQVSNGAEFNITILDDMADSRSETMDIPGVSVLIDNGTYSRVGEIQLNIPEILIHVNWSWWDEQMKEWQMQIGEDQILEYNQNSTLFSLHRNITTSTQYDDGSVFGTSLVQNHNFNISTGFLIHSDYRFWTWEGNPTNQTASFVFYAIDLVSCENIDPTHLPEGLNTQHSTDSEFTDINSIDKSGVTSNQENRTTLDRSLEIPQIVIIIGIVILGLALVMAIRFK